MLIVTFLRYLVGIAIVGNFGEKKKLLDLLFFSKVGCSCQLIGRRYRMYLIYGGLADVHGFACK